ncbi:SUMF1/EgtB/PvdO family nonheme iron enzyme [Myxococcota bacterium]|nr:SUMF1/EgtB/PvdO family nonheme iron enzyme [Myxococcota bacterium]
MATRVREWTLHEEIGHGGMGVVFRATHDHMGGIWAVKVIRPDLAFDESSRRRFEAEVRTHSTLQHPGIVGVQTPFFEQGRMYLPMEFLDGCSLADMMAAQPGPWKHAGALRIIRDAAAALGYAHARPAPVIHRDIKPGNIQIMEDGRVKLLDFGLARTAGDQSLTGTGQLVGTPAFMAPEVLKGEPATARSDVYSLGMVLYRMLTGRMPFDLPASDSSLQAVFIAVITGIEAGFPDVRTYVPTIPADVAEVTMRAVSRDPAMRPANGNELVALLAGLCVEKEGVADVAGVLPTTPMTPQRPQSDVTRIAFEITPDGNDGAGKDVVGRNGGVQAVGVNHARPNQGGQNQGGQNQGGPKAGGPADPANRRPGAAAPLSILPFIAVGVAVVVLIGAAVWWFVFAYPKLTAGAATEGAESEYEGAAEEGEAAGTASERNPGDLEWVTIPGGSFLMGSTGGENKELPVHQVNVPTFEISRSEVTNLQYGRCVDAGVCSPPHWDDGKCQRFDGRRWTKGGAIPFSVRGADQPVVCVDWVQAADFARWVGGRLPTEAEWEYAARGAGKIRRYPWGDDIATCDRAVMEGSSGWGCGRVSSWPVCSKPNGNTDQGVCDMAGNVWEWCQDNGHDNYYGAPSDGSAWFGGTDRRVNRGGAWSGNAERQRSTFRDSSPPDYCAYNFGIRVARTAR